MESNAESSKVGKVELKMRKSFWSRFRSCELSVAPYLWDEGRGAMGHVGTLRAVVGGGGAR